MKSGFEKFQEQCRFCRYAFITDFKIADCSYTINPITPFCTHEDNEFEQDGKKYFKKCRLYRCPFYSERKRDYNWGVFMDHFMTLSVWLQEHSNESDTDVYHIYNSWIHQNSDCMIDLSDKSKSLDMELKEFLQKKLDSTQK